MRHPNAPEAFIEFLKECASYFENLETGEDRKFWAKVYNAKNLKDIALCIQQNEGLIDFQQRVGVWIERCFPTPIVYSAEERNHRFLEEALELVQSLDCTREEAHMLVDYVFDRPVGEPHQEMGGVLVTLAALSKVAGINMVMAAKNEYERINQPEVIEKIRRKQASKPSSSPLPGSAT